VDAHSFTGALVVHGAFAISRSQPSITKAKEINQRFSAH